MLVVDKIAMALSVVDYPSYLKYIRKCYPDGCLNVLSVAYMGVILWEAGDGTG